MYNFFCWRYRHANFMAGNKLITKPQINSLKSALNKCELFESIQTYDKDSNTLYAPIYADLDGKTAVDDCIEIVETIENEFDIMPNIYFSGSKGFHIVIPFKVVSLYPHEVSRAFFKGLGSWESLDQNVYTGRRMFRVAGSIHYATGKFKTRITADELGFLGNEISEICTKQVFENDYEWIENDELNECIEQTKKIVVNTKKNEQNQSNNNTYGVQFTPCMKRIITTAPNDGEWNATIVTIARFFNKAGIDKNIALDILMNFEHWKNASSRGHKLESIFNSIYRRDSFFSCRGNDLLERHCDIFCMFNQEDIYEMS